MLVNFPIKGIPRYISGILINIKPESYQIIKINTLTATI